MTKRYSIIIPNRNQPDLLRRALASIPVREDVEVIVVDDASDPSLMDMQHYPGSERPDCQVLLTTEGKGAGYARNKGLEMARGEWLVFLDSDDFFTEGFLSLLDAHTGDTADIVFFGITSVCSDTLEPSTRHVSRMETLARYSNRPALLEFCCRHVWQEPWGKMIRRTLVVRNGFRFDETVYANDALFSAKTGQAAASIGYDDRILYCLTTRKGSLSEPLTPQETARRTSDQLDVYWRVLQFNRKHGIRHLLFFYSLYKSCIRSGGEKAVIARRFAKEHRIGKLDLFFHTRMQELRHKLRIGVPYCK